MFRIGRGHRVAQEFDPAAREPGHRTGHIVDDEREPPDARLKCV